MYSSIAYEPLTSSLIIYNGLFVLFDIITTLGFLEAPLGANLNESDISLIQIINGNNMESGMSPNLSSFGGCNSPYKMQRQVASGRERKRVLRTAPNG